MTYSSLLIKSTGPIVLDTSVLINLHASSCGGRILAALPNSVVIPEIVMAELEHETSKANGGYKFIQDLVSSGKAQSAALDGEEYKVYQMLVSGVTSLDDGEAATIAIASNRNLLPIIDERKGRRKAEILCASISGWSLDLFQHPEVVVDLGQDDSANAIYLALRDGRMRIHEDHCDHVLNIIGSKRALECSSLPGYKTKKRQWQNLIT